MKLGKIAKGKVTEMSRNIFSCFYFGQTKSPLVLINAIQ